MRRGSTVKIGATLLVVTLVGGACSSTTAVSGRGSVAAPTGSQITGFPTSSPSARSSSASPSPVPTSSAPGTSSAPPTSGASQVCPVRANPPFCFSLPAGFRDYTYLSTYGRGWQYRTLVSLGRHDLIEVLATRFKVDTDSDSYAQLQSYFDKNLRSKPGRYHVRKAGPVRRVRVDGARAFEQHMIFIDGVRGDTTTIFRARAVVSLGCQSATRTAAVRAGCTRVHHTLHLR